MSDPDFWKRPYERTWKESSARETAIAEYIESCTGTRVVTAGLGAGSDEFLAGSSASHGYSKGDADLLLPAINLQIEVTGPLTESDNADDAIWLRPDKLKNAYRKATGSSRTEIWVVHCLGQRGLRRAIHLDPSFYRSAVRGEFEKVRPTIRGNRECYVAIPAEHACVKQLDALVDYIMKST
jgi:hypothetical protein